MRPKSSFAVALGGMTAALSLVLMLLSRIIPFSEQALPAMAGVLLIIAVLEAGPLWAFVIYAAVGLLSLFFAFQNGAAIYYIFFFGHYTILKNYIERIHPKPLQWLCKLAVFNLSAVIAYFLSVTVAGIPDDLIKYGYPVALAIVNAAFIVYDIALSRLIAVYIYRLRKVLKIH